MIPKSEKPPLLLLFFTNKDWEKLDVAVIGSAALNLNWMQSGTAISGTAAVS